jgi:hypothetical protein
MFLFIHRALARGPVSRLGKPLVGVLAGATRRDASLPSMRDLMPSRVGNLLGEGVYLKSREGGGEWTSMDGADRD